ncbi:MAG: hypothetical protein QXM27_01525 [Candidatus Pacearchaeota archaeon]
MKKKDLKKKVKDSIREVIEYYVGNYGNKLVDILYNKKNINEFLIAEKIKLNIHQVRNMLYKLAGKNLITFSRKHDKKSGWYIYYWTLREERILEELKNLKLKKMYEIENQIKSKQYFNFYICPNKCVTMKEETALLHNFFCPECGELLLSKDTKEEIKKLEEEKEKIKKSLEKIDELILIYKREKSKKLEKKKKPKIKKIKKKRKKLKVKKKNKVKPKKRKIKK